MRAVLVSLFCAWLPQARARSGFADCGNGIFCRGSTQTHTPDRICSSSMCGCGYCNQGSLYPCSGCWPE